MMRSFSRRTLLAGPLLASLAPAAATAAQSEPGQTETEGVPFFRGNLARTGEHPGPGPIGEPVERWALKIGQFFSSSPAVAGGVVYVGSIVPSTLEGGALFAVEAATGRELWRCPTDLGDAFFSAPALVDGVVYVGSYDGVVLAADAATGEERWRFQAEAGIFSSPAVVEGLLYIGDDAGRLYAVDAGDGELRWRFAIDDPFERGMGAAPAVVDGTVFAVTGARRSSATSFLHALDAATGEERWRFAAEEGGNVRGTVAVVDNRVCVPTLDGFLYAVDAAEGKEQWRYDVEGATQTSPAVVDGLAYLATGGALHSVEAASGEPRWSRRLTDGADLITHPTVAAGKLYVCDAAGTLYAVDAASGDDRWQVNARTYFASPAIVGDTVYAAGDDGVLRAFSSRPKHDLPSG
jgi:outer membrane protein assembly factor BamB